MLNNTEREAVRRRLDVAQTLADAAAHRMRDLEAELLATRQERARHLYEVESAKAALDPRCTHASYCKRAAVTMVGQFPLCAEHAEEVTQ